MPNPFIGVRISPELNEAIITRMKETGQSKSDIVIEALKSYLQMSSLQQRLEGIEQRLSALEKIAEETKISSQSTSNREHHHIQGNQH